MTKQKAIAVALLTILGGALLIYSGSRTVHLIELTLPDDQKALAYFGLAAFDGGLVLWTLYALWGARGAWQRGISAIMIAVSLVGVVIAFGADTFVGAGQRGLVAELDPGTISGIMLAVVAVIAVNIAAVTACHYTDPDALRQAAEESARDKILAAELRQIAENADALAADLAPVRAASWRQSMQAEHLADLPPELRDAFLAAQRARLEHDAWTAKHTPVTVGQADQPALLQLAEALKMLTAGQAGAASTYAAERPAVVIERREDDDPGKA